MTRHNTNDNAHMRTTRNDVMIMNENTIANDVNDVVTNANDDNATTTRTRETTRALRNVRVAKNAKNATTRDENDNVINVVRTSTNALRIDHSNCTHAKTKNDRSKCRASIERANAKKSK